MKVKILFLLITLLIFGCENRIKKDQKRVDGYIQQARRLVKQQTLLKWFNIVHNKPMNIADTYNAHPELFSLQTINFVNFVHQETKNQQRVRELLFFRNYLIQGFEFIQNTEINKQIENILMTPIILGGKKYLLERINPVKIDRTKLREFSNNLHSYKKAYSLLHSLIVQRIRKQNELAKQLGFPDAIEMSATLRHFSPAQLRSLSENFLQSSDSIYVLLLNEMSRKFLNKNASAISLSELFYLRTALQLQDEFKSTNLTMNMKWFLSGLQIDIDKQKNLKILLTSNPEVLFGAYCVAIEIPTDIRLAVSLTGDFEDYLNYFGEMGRAQHFIHTKTKNWVFQMLGPEIAQDTFVELFRNILADTLWLNQYIPFSSIKQSEFLKFWRFRQLLEKRHLAALFLYEYEMYSGKKDLPSIYRQLFENALKVKLHPSEFYWDIAATGQFFSNISRLQAAFLEPIFYNYLKENFGVDWFKNPAAKKWMQKIWEKGNYWLPSELIKMTGNQILSEELLIRRLGLQ